MPASPAQTGSSAAGSTCTEPSSSQPAKAGADSAADTTEAPSHGSRASIAPAYGHRPTRRACRTVTGTSSTSTAKPASRACVPQSSSSADPAITIVATATSRRTCRDQTSNARLARPVSRGSTGQAGS